jgi:hypothetical protein
MRLLRKIIRSILWENRDQILVEPDIIDDDDAHEASVVANISGVTTPLGTGPTHPNRPKRKKSSKKSSAYIAGRSFGGGTPVLKKKKK